MISSGIFLNCAVVDKPLQNEQLMLKSSLIAQSLRPNMLSVSESFNMSSLSKIISFIDSKVNLLPCKSVNNQTLLILNLSLMSNKTLIVFLMWTPEEVSYARASKWYLSPCSPLNRPRMGIITCGRIADPTPFVFVELLVCPLSQCFWSISKLTFKPSLPHTIAHLHFTLTSWQTVFNIDPQQFHSLLFPHRN